MDSDLFENIVNEQYPLFFKGKQKDVVKMILRRLNTKGVDISKEMFINELSSIINTEVIIPYITSPIRRHHIYNDVLKVQDRRANYSSMVLETEKYNEWRKKAQELTDEVCAKIVEEYYPKTFDNNRVVAFILATIFQDGQDLTPEIFTLQMKYLYSINMYNNYTLNFLKDVKLSSIIDKLIYRIYLDAFFHTVNLSEYKEFDDKVKEFFNKAVFQNYGNDNAKKWLALFESRKDLIGHLQAQGKAFDGVHPIVTVPHLKKKQITYYYKEYKYPPFYVYNEPDGDTVFTRENRGIYDYPLPSKPSFLAIMKWRMSKMGFKFSFHVPSSLSDNR